MALLKERTAPIRPADPDRVARLIADLDSPRFGTREKAAEVLEQLGEAALPALRKALAGRPSAEVRKHVQQLVDRLTERLPRGPELRQLRAIEVLERVATADARRVLDGLAKGVPDARQTRAAQDALHRLNQDRP